MDYLEINRKLWNDKVPVHLKSDFYNVDEFRKIKNSLNEIELNALGDVTGKKMLHLQCHFGMDTLSWSNKGAIVTGIDFSDVAISHAKKISDELDLDATFICSDVYSLKENLNENFDIVFTSYGTIGWLPDLNKWAEIVSHFLKPGGIFYIVDFHPVLWMFDNDFKYLEYSYFNLEPIVEEMEGTYADRTAYLKNKSIGWNHDISEILKSLLQHGMQIMDFNEYDFSPYKCFNNMIVCDDGLLRIKGLERKIPMMYSITAKK